MESRKRQSGFTLIELLIVVVILGIIAAIVIPQFSVATTDAKLAAVQTNLGTMRAQLQLYKFQHNDLWPTEADVVAQLTGETDIAGLTSGTGFGPYLLSIPDNPFVGLATVEAATAGTIGNDTHGWFYNQTTGVIQADSAGHGAL
ncbi:MAG: type II secretion system protein [Planctomycetes bacterium]|nr:type II secretion system protein [Planctomycetota bacterium]MCH8970375.1 type II secretion system protein [Planctomycetota bacterium]